MGPKPRPAAPDRPHKKLPGAPREPREERRGGGEGLGFRHKGLSTGLNKGLEGREGSRGSFFVLVFGV